VRREISVKPTTNAPRWIRVKASDGERLTLAFTGNPKGRAYMRGLLPAEVAWTLARAAGHWGSGAKYLYHTVPHLDSFGIRDRNLWRLQELVAREIVNWKAAENRAP
jgi:cation transport protein ChaC